MSVEQLIEDLSANEMREILERKGYCLPASISEKCMRATLLGDYEHGLIGGLEIRLAFDDRDARIEAANRIIADQVRAIAELHAEVNRLKKVA